MAVDLEFRADGRYLPQQLSLNLDACKAFPSPFDLTPQLVLLRTCRRSKLFRIAVKSLSLFHNLDPLLRFVLSLHFDVETEAIEQLRPQFTFLGVAGTD